MHPEVRTFVAEQVRDFGPFERVIEFGSRDINGEIRDLFGEHVTYVGVDAVAGPGVDIVADVTEWTPVWLADCVVCCEVLEHSDKPAAIIEAMARATADDGIGIVTAACDPRGSHSAVDGGPTLKPGEHYANIDPVALSGWLRTAFGGLHVVVTSPSGDVRGFARKQPR